MEEVIKEINDDEIKMDEWMEHKGTRNDVENITKKGGQLNE